MAHTSGGPLELRICEFNVENLFVGMEYYEGQDLERTTEAEWREMALPQMRARQKPLRKLWGLAAAVDDIEPDVAMLVEVGGRDSLENFNRHFLADRYTPFFVEGNSRRGIDLGFLVRRDLPLVPEIRSHRKAPVEVHAAEGRYLARFSRDVAELRLHDAEDRVRLVLLLVHLKSKLSTDKDRHGKDVRTAEAFALARVYDELAAQLPDVPIIVGGDFNADITSLELEVVRRTNLTDFRDLIGTPLEERATLVHFDGAGEPHSVVLDYLMVSPHLVERINPARSYVYRYSTFGAAEDLPTTPARRRKMPSDHYPLVLTVKV